MTSGEIELSGSPSIDWLGVPLLRGERAVGALVVQSYDEGVRFDEGDLDMLTFVSRHVASAIDKVRGRDALRESEARFRTLAETAPCAIFIYQGSEFRFVNDAAAELSGYTPDEMLRLSFFDLVHPEFRDRVRERGLARQRGEAVPTRYEFKILTKSGEERWLDFSSGVIEFGGRSAALGTAFDVTDRRRGDERMRTLAYHDPLTGLPNRLLFHDRLELAVAQAHRSRERLAVLFVDLDGFKLINDSLGHAVGDRLLEKVSERLVSCVREGDTVARLGGDEFTLILPGLHRIDELPPLAEKVLDVAAPSPALGEPRAVRDRQHGGEPLPGRRGGRGHPGEERRHGHVPGQGGGARPVPALRALHERLRGRAPGRGEQPAPGPGAQRARCPSSAPWWTSSTGNVFGVEALVRWPPASEGAGEGGSRSPADLASFMVPIAPWLVRTACRQVVQWQEAGLPGLRVSVRLSARQFRQVDLIPDVQLALAEAGLDPHCLELDVTDTSALPQAHASARGLAELRELGVRLTIDDFAIGDASLGALRQLPMDAWKIDRGPGAATAQEPRGRRRGDGTRGPRARPAPGGGGRGHRGGGSAGLPGRPRMRPPARRPVAPPPGREGVPGAPARSEFRGEAPVPATRASPEP